MDHLEVISADLLMPFVKQMKLYYPWMYAKTKVRAELAVHEKKQEQLKILNGTSSLIPKEMARNKPSNIDSFSDDPVATVQMWDELDKKRDRMKSAKNENFLFNELKLFTRMEQSPNPTSRIKLDAERDQLGVPRAVLDWQLSSIDKRSIRKLQEIIGEEVGRSELGRVRLMDWLQEENSKWPSTLGGGWHHMGTTRMSNDPKEGVVDANCKVFGIQNLYMAGSSCFPTSGAANPTFTLLALTFRLSEHLKKNAANNFNLDVEAT